MSTDPVRGMLLLYPRAWRERYADEIHDLCDELIERHETTSLRLALRLVPSVFHARFVSLRVLPRRRLAIGALLACACMVGFVLTVSGGSRPLSSTVHSGGIPGDSVITVPPSVSANEAAAALEGGDGTFVVTLPTSVGSVALRHEYGVTVEVNVYQFDQLHHILGKDATTPIAGNGQVFDVSVPPGTYYVAASLSIPSTRGWGEWPLPRRTCSNTAFQATVKPGAMTKVTVSCPSWGISSPGTHHGG